MVGRGNPMTGNNGSLLRCCEVGRTPLRVNVNQKHSDTCRRARRAVKENVVCHPTRKIFKRYLEYSFVHSAAQVSSYLASRCTCFRHYCSALLHHQSLSLAISIDRKTHLDF